MDALTSLLEDIPADFAGTFFIAQHTSPLNGRCYLADVLKSRTSLTVRVGVDQAKVIGGEVVIAPPDRHMLIHDDRIQLTKGPKENHSRPATDPLFRSAAATHQSRTVGIVLSGYLDDGSSGLLAVRGCGGTALVQSPNDADVPDMPSNALSYLEPDIVGTAKELGQAAYHYSQTTAGPSVPPTLDVLHEIELSQGIESMIDVEDKMGIRSSFMCPECDGQLWQLNVDKVPRFRCHVGHAHTLRSLDATQDQYVERPTWATF